MSAVLYECTVLVRRKGRGLPQSLNDNGCKFFEVAGVCVNVMSG